MDSDQFRTDMRQESEQLEETQSIPVPLIDDSTLIVIQVTPERNTSNVEFEWGVGIRKEGPIHPDVSDIPPED